MEEQFSRIRDLADARRLTASDFERLIHEALDAKLPFCVLPNVVLFRPDQFAADVRKSYAKAYELDNLFHYRVGEIDYIVIVETKNQAIQEQNGQWLVRYTKPETGVVDFKDARIQLESHAKTILRYLRPLGRNVELKVRALLVSSDRATKDELPAHNEAIWMGKCGYESLRRWIETLQNRREALRPNVLKVAQSEFMALLRLGIPVPSLGHPELRHAIHYIARCKREIDVELFRTFEPSKRRWAINATAGMGKSVLLAYATAVFACGQEITSVNDTLRLRSHEMRSAEMGMLEVKGRNICVFAMKPKQRQVLEQLYGLFMRELSDAAPAGELNFLKPRFDVWNDAGGVPKGCNILVVDEAHDLSPTGQDIIRRWHEASGQNYLMLACDRHQKIRFAGQNATLIKGLTFSGFTTRLNRNYRNPFPIYAAALALMFRWFANAGPKVMPSNRELQDWLGFDLDATAEGDQVTLHIRNDAHPANAWSHCIGAFNNCAAAFSHLSQQNLTKSEVLWVRFSKEAADFDYEQLSNFTYHNFATPESSDLVDKYVKGQEFPIVVLEGFPKQMDDFGEWRPRIEEIDPREREMWRFRRELYLCASRATGFLYFICNVTQTEHVKRIEDELAGLITALSTPVVSRKASGKIWRFTLKKSNQARNVDVFPDAVEQGGFQTGGRPGPQTTKAPQFRASPPPGGSGRTTAPSSPPQPAMPGVRLPAPGPQVSGSGIRKIAPEKEPAKAETAPQLEIELNDPVTVRDLAEEMGIKPWEVMSDLNEMNMSRGINEVLEPALAIRLARIRGFSLRLSS